MVPASLLPLIADFHIGPLLLSYHLPLSCSVALKINISMSILPHHSWFCPVKLKWDTKTKRLFNSVVIRGSLLVCIPSNDEWSPNTPLDNFNLLIKFLVNVLGQIHPPRVGTLQHKYHGDFDNIPWSLKQVVCQIYKEYKDNKSPKLPLAYFSTKLQLVQVIKSNQQHISCEHWQHLLKAVIASNQRLFWKIVISRVSHTNSDSPYLIPASTWESHCRKLFWDDCPQGPSQANTEVDEMSNWIPVSAAEMLSRIGHLKLGKAAGPITFLLI